jgi:hypothetical protein
MPETISTALPRGGAPSGPDILSPHILFFIDFVTSLVFMKMMALAGEKSRLRPFVFKEMTALGVCALEGH